MSFFNSIPLWGWFDIGFNILVLAALGGETDILLKQLFPEKMEDLVSPEGKRKTFKKWCEWLLILGIAGEIACLPFSIYGTASAKKEAADAELQAARSRERADALEKQIDEMKLNVEAMSANVQNGFANLAPSNQPITSIEASVNFFVAGTNTEIFNEQFLKDLTEGWDKTLPADQVFEEMTELSFASASTNFPIVGRNFRPHLYCETFETSLGREWISLGPVMVVSFNLKFGPNKSEAPFFDASDQRIWQKFTVGDLEKNNIAYLDNVFLKDGDKIIKGTCILKINEDVKTFSVWRSLQTTGMNTIIFVADIPTTNNFGL